MSDESKCPICGSEREYNPQIQEYPGACIWHAYWYCPKCDDTWTLPINTGSVKENTRGW